MKSFRAVVACVFVVSAAGLLSRQGRSISARYQDDPFCMQDRKAPSVFLLGVQKAGTSSLWHDLMDRFNLVGSHPIDNEPSWRAKEVAFFNNADRYKRGKNFYLRHFPKCNEVEMHEKVIDASPNALLASDDVAWKVKDFYGDRSKDLRFVVIVRDPSARMESGYWHFNPGEQGNFDNYVQNTIVQARKWASGESKEQPLPNLYQGSMYSQNLKPWLDAFGQEQFAFVTLKQYQDKPNATMSFIADRIGMSMKRNTDKPSTSIHAHKRQHEMMSAKTKKMLSEFFRTYDNDLAGLLKEKNISPKWGLDQENLWEGEKREVGKKIEEDLPKNKAQIVQQTLSGLFR